MNVFELFFSTLVASIFVLFLFRQTHDYREVVGECEHKEWTPETKANGWRSECGQCGLKAQGSCQ